MNWPCPAPVDATLRAFRVVEVGIDGGLD